MTRNPLSPSLALMAALTVGPLAPAGAADPGAAAWTREYPQADGTPARSCATCHGADLRQPGRHARTGKSIEPMAPSVNPQRLSDQAKVDKWLLRNCRWTLGRECTPEEKTTFLDFIRSQ